MDLSDFMNLHDFSKSRYHTFIILKGKKNVVLRLNYFIEIELFQLILIKNFLNKS